MKRYIKNMNSLSKKEMEILSKSKVCVVGCGGLGGYIVEILGRIGIGYMSVIDGDIFDETNLNRQIVCHTQNIGFNKAEETMKRMKLVNPNIVVKPIAEMLNERNAIKLLSGHDVIVDALDNIDSRKILHKYSSKLNIPLVHGAIAGFYGQITTIFPDDNTFNYIYSNYKNSNKGIEKKLGNPSFIPPIIASIETSEVVKILINKGNILRNKLLVIDLLNNNFDIIDFE